MQTERVIMHSERDLELQNEDVVLALERARKVLRLPEALHLLARAGCCSGVAGVRIEGSGVQALVGGVPCRCWGCTLGKVLRGKCWGLRVGHLLRDKWTALSGPLSSAVLSEC